MIMGLAKSAGSARQMPGALCPVSIFYSVFLFFFWLGGGGEGEEREREDSVLYCLYAVTTVPEIQKVWTEE